MHFFVDRMADSSKLPPYHFESVDILKHIRVVVVGELHGRDKKLVEIDEFSGFKNLVESSPEVGGSLGGGNDEVFNGVEGGRVD